MSDNTRKTSNIIHTVDDLNTTVNEIKLDVENNTQDIGKIKVYDADIKLSASEGLTVVQNGNTTANAQNPSEWKLKADTNYLNTTLNFAKPDQIPSVYVKDIVSGDITTLTVENNNGTYTLTAIGGSGGGGTGNITFAEGTCIDIAVDTISDSQGNDVKRYTISTDTDCLNTTLNFAKPTDIGDGNITLSNGTGINISGTDATANQTGDSGWSVSIDDTVALKSDIPTIPPAVVPGDGDINLTGGTGIDVTGSNATANQTGNTSWSVAIDDTVALKSDIPTIPNVPTVLADLSDVSDTTPADDQILTYNGTSKTWEPAASQSGGVTTLAALDDTNVSTPTEGQTLVWNNTDSKWENKTVDASGGVSNLPISSTDNKVTLSDDDGTFIVKTGDVAGSQTNQLVVADDGVVGVNIDDPNLAGGGEGIHIHSDAAGDNSELHMTTFNTGSAAGDGLNIQMGSDKNVKINNRSDGSIQMFANNDESFRINKNSVRTFEKFGVNTDPAYLVHAKDVDDSELFYSVGFAYVRQSDDKQSGVFLINNNAEGNANRGIWGLALEDGSKNDNSLYIYNSGVSGVGTDPRFEFTAGSTNNFIIKQGQLQTDTITTKDAASGDPADGKNDGDKVIRLKGNQVQISDQDHDYGTGGYSLDIRDNRGTFRLRNDDVVNGINDTAKIVLDVNSNNYNTCFEFRAGNVVRAEIVKQGIAGNQYWAQYCSNGSASGLEFRTAFGKVTEKTFENHPNRTVISTFEQDNDPDSDNYRGIENYVDRLTITKDDIKASDDYVPQTDDSLVTKGWVQTNAAAGDFLPLAGGTFDIAAHVVMPSGNTVSPQLQVGCQEDLTGTSQGSNFNLIVSGNKNDAAGNKNAIFTVWSPNDTGIAYMKWAINEDATEYWNVLASSISTNAGYEGSRFWQVQSGEGGAFITCTDSTDSTKRQVTINQTYLCTPRLGTVNRAVGDAELRMMNSSMVVAAGDYLGNDPVTGDDLGFTGLMNKVLLGSYKYKANNSDEGKVRYASLSTRNGSFAAMPQSVANENTVAIDIYEQQNNPDSCMSIQWNAAAGAFNRPAAEIKNVRQASGANFHLTFSAMVSGELKEYLTLGGNQLLANASYVPTEDNSLVTKKYVDSLSFPTPPEPEFPLPPVGIGAGTSWEEKTHVPGMYFSAAYATNGVFTMLGMESIGEPYAVSETTNQYVCVPVSYWSVDGVSWAKGFVGGDWLGITYTNNSTAYPAWLHNKYGRNCEADGTIFNGFAYSSTGKSWQNFKGANNSLAGVVPLWWQAGISDTAEEAGNVSSSFPDNACFYTSHMYAQPDLSAGFDSTQRYAYMTKAERDAAESRTRFSPKWGYSNSNNGLNYMQRPIVSKQVMDSQPDKSSISYSNEWKSLGSDCVDAASTPEGEKTVFITEDNKALWLDSGYTNAYYVTGIDWSATALVCGYDRVNEEFAVALSDKVVLYSRAGNQILDRGGNNLPVSASWVRIVFSGDRWVLMDKNGQVVVGVREGGQMVWSAVGVAGPTVTSQDMSLAGTNGRFFVVGGTDRTGYSDFGSSLSGKDAVVPIDQPTESVYSFSGSTADNLFSSFTTGDKTIKNQQQANEFLLQEISRLQKLIDEKCDS